MRALTTRRWGGDVSPWHELETLNNRLRRWVDYPELGTAMFGTPMFADKAWFPPVELFEQDDEFLLTAELPGMLKENVDLSIDDNVLTLKGEKKAEHEVAHDRMHLRERAYGMFERSFVLPKNVDAGKIRAEFHHGLIEIHMPKGEKSKSKHIEIKLT